MFRVLASCHRDRLLVGVDHEDQIRQAAHVLDAAERALQLVALAGQLQGLLLGETDRGLGEPAFELAQAADRVRDRLPVGQHAAEPAVVDVVLARAAGAAGDRLLRLALGADEQDPAAARGDVAGRDQRLVQQRHGLGQVDDVHAVAHTEQIRRHPGIPAPGLMTEMDAGLEQLAHREVGDCHGSILAPVQPPRVKVRLGGRTPERHAYALARHPRERWAAV